MSEDQYVIDAQGNIDNIPDGIPPAVAGGTYLCRFAKSVTQRTSRFDPTRYYFEWPMILQDTKGNKFEFNFNFSPKSQIFTEILRLMGGKEMGNGIVKPPQNSVVGRYFMAEITKEAQKNDPSKFTNKIIRVWAYEQKEETAQRVAAEIEENKEKFPIDKDEEEPAF